MKASRTGWGLSSFQVTRKNKIEDFYFDLGRMCSDIYIPRKLQGIAWGRSIPRELLSYTTYRSSDITKNPESSGPTIREHSDDVCDIRLEMENKRTLGKEATLLTGISLPVVV